jgi:hypothetical protein
MLKDIKIDIDDIYEQFKELELTLFQVYILTN